VDRLWQKFFPVVEKVLNGTNTSTDLNTIRTANLIILAEMNKAVSMMQKQAEGLVSLLINLQIFLLILGTAFIIFAFLSIQSITSRLKMTHSSVVAGEVASDISNVNEDSDTINEASTIVADNARDLSGLAGELNTLVEKLTIR
jgi:methyl-accepting chemotaxis protein